MKDNSFASSYAEFTKTLTENSVIKKILIEGGFSKGYGDIYADAKQIECKYYNPATETWLEYDIDTTPDLNLTLSTGEFKLRLGLQDRYLGNDRLPYISKLAVLYELGDIIPDVGIRTYEILDITQPLEVIEL